MKTASVSILKKELSTLPYSEVLKICMQLVKYKKENKELLNYLLFDAGNEQEYVNTIKGEIDFCFQEINTNHLYFAKKSIRKILKITTKYIRYSSHKRTEVDLLIYFCIKLKNSGIPIRTSTSLSNLFDRQVEKIKIAISTMNEDLQFDYMSELKLLTE